MNISTNKQEAAMCMNPATPATPIFLATPYEYKVLGTAERAATPYSSLEELADRGRRAIDGDPAAQAAFDGVIAMIEKLLPTPVKWTSPITTGTAMRAARA